MSRRSQENVFRRFFSSRTFLVVAVIVLALVALGYARAYYTDWKVRTQINELQDEVRRLETKRLESIQILDYVTSDAFVEEKARTELNMKKPGEHVVVIEKERQENAERSSEVSSSDEVGQVIGNPLKWWYYFTAPERLK